MLNIEQRLSNLERSNRRWRLLALVVLGCICVRLLFGAVAPASFDTLTAKRIEVVDANGTRVGVFDGDEGAGSLLLWSSRNKSQVSINAGLPKVPQPLVDLTNADGSSIVSLFGNKDGSGFVGVYSAGGKERIALVGRASTTQPAKPSDVAGIVLRDNNEVQRAELSADQDGARAWCDTLTAKRILVVDDNETRVGVFDGKEGAGSLSLWSSRNKSQVSINAGLPKFPQPLVDLTNADGNSIVSLAGEGDGSGFAGVCSAAGKQRITLEGHYAPTTQPAKPQVLTGRNTSNVARLSLLDENGNMRAFWFVDETSSGLGLVTHELEGASFFATASDVFHSGIVVKQPGGGPTVSWP